jgi:hypothetical protein
MARLELDVDSTRLLKAIDSASRTRGEPVVRGSEVMRTLGLTPDSLVALLRDLSSKNLVTVAGPLTPDRIDFAMISLHPSNRGFVDAL